MKIAFIPIDNRPVCYTLAQQIAEIDSGIKLFLPPRELLGDLTKTADIKGILQWFKTLEDVDKIVVSLDTIAHGGLIPSRRSTDTFDEIKARIEEFKKTAQDKKSKVYAFSSIMRISNNNVNEEEKEYWSLYGEKIFKYSFETHKQAPKSCFPNDVPLEIIQDYLLTRKRNFEINELYLDWKKQGFFETLVFSKDDCAKYGFNVAEAQSLQTKIKDLKLENTLVKTGADEIPLSLLSRALTEGKRIKIAPIYTEPDFVNVISKYEDVDVSDSVKGQIELAGCEVSTTDEADIILVVNNFKHEQGELVMGVKTQGFSKQLSLPQKPFLIADILNANGSDNNFVKQFLEQNIDWENFLGYAGWNTTGNTLGSVLCCALVKYLADNPDFTAFKKVQTVRFLDDWAYQANVRKILKSRLKDIDSSELKKEMIPYENVLKEKFGTNFCDIKYTYPWKRFFEIEVSLY